jgi:DNA-binding winged helix-turn-helix (wHTH) protein
VRYASGSLTPIGSHPTCDEPHVGAAGVDALAHLVEHRDTVVTKTESCSTQWGDRFVSESALTSAHAAQPSATTAPQSVIRTVHGRATSSCRRR